MSTGAPDSTHPTTATGPRRVVEFGKYIDDQLSKVRAYVRLSSLATRATGFALGACAFLFLFVLIDHWVVDLGRWGRLAGFLALLVGTAAFVVRGIMPLLIRRINPAYAASVIERSQPSLKNSLVNFVFFRSHRGSMRKVVYELVERQAATNLSRVAVDDSIDHAPLIRTGTALASLLIAFVLYTWLSPKDSLQTVARVLMPWSERSRPSRVRIYAVQPGNTQVYAGRHLSISASIENLGNGDKPTLVYSSVDGQVTQSHVPMQRESDRPVWQTDFPPGTSGIYQDLTYQIQAGDAVAGPFHVSVLPSPSIVVDKVEYAFPEYTNIAAKTLAGQGDIAALEGSRVTIHAVANQDIQYAYLEFDPPQSIDAPWHDTETTEPAAQAARSTLTMKHEGQHAWVSFTLALKPDRITPWHSSYQLRFENLDGEKNDRPIQYRLQVTPDVPPHVEILTPQQREMLLAENSQQKIEIRAVDPDFGLSDIRLRAVNRAAALLDQRLLSEPTTGQKVVQYVFSPSRLGLSEGDLVTYWAVASDNRADATNGSPAPNVTNTVQYHFRIAAADGQQSANDDGDTSHRPDDSTAPGQDQRPASDTQNGPDNGNQDGDQANDRRDPSHQDQENNPQNSDQGQDSEKQPADAPRENSTDGEAVEQNRQANDGQTNQTADQPNDEAAADSQQNESQQDPGSPGSSNDKSNETKRGDPGNQDGRQGPRSDESSREQSGAEPGDSSLDKSSANSDGDPQPGTQRNAPENGDASQPATNHSPSANDAAEPANQFSDDDSSPLPNDGSRDGDAMERILKRIKDQTGRSPDQEDVQPSSCDNCNDGSCDACQAAKENGGRSRDAGNAGNQQTNRNRTSDGDRQPDQSSSDKTPPGERSPEGDSERAVPRPTDGSQEVRDANNTEPNGSPRKKPVDNAQSDQANERAEQSPSNEKRDSGSNTPDGQSDQPKNDPGQTADGKSGDSENPGNGSRPGGNSERPQSSPPTGGSKDKESQPGDAADGQKGQPGQGEETTASESPESGERPGRNSDSRGSDSPAGSSQENADQSSDTPGTNQTSSQPGGNSAESPGGAASASQPSGGQSGDATGNDEDLHEQAGDDANLEYARKATELVLEFLQNEQNRSDRDLLEQLGWSRGDIDAFLRRWRQMKQTAERQDETGKTARRELDDVLRSLGLQPKLDRTQRAGSRVNRISGVQDAGGRSQPPPQYRERYKRFLKSVATQRDTTR